MLFSLDPLVFAATFSFGTRGIHNVDLQFSHSLDERASERLRNSEKAPSIWSALQNCLACNGSNNSKGIVWQVYIFFRVTHDSLFPLNWFRIFFFTSIFFYLYLFFATFAMRFVDDRHRAKKIEWNERNIISVDFGWCRQKAGIKLVSRFQFDLSCRFSIAFSLFFLPSTR